ncbi:spore germination protein [Polycladospora coralii]|uniref:spore germination protein n=1 Tax=Polycladospora coralii TaxID=2771432 RepID=UPI0020BF76B8|nr:spore germination protein [Polycladospora coralii]
MWKVKTGDADMANDGKNFRILKTKNKLRKQQLLEKHYQQQLEEHVEDVKLSTDLKVEMEALKKSFGESGDLIARTMDWGGTLQQEIGIVYLDELANKDLVQNFVIRPLLQNESEPQNKGDIWEEITKNIVEAGEIKEITHFKEAVDAILMGDTVLLMDGFDKGLVIGSKGWVAKGISNTRAESVIRGSQEALNETICISLSMIRRRLKDPQLRIKSFTVGERTKTGVMVLHIEGVADDEMVNEVNKRIEAIKIDGILESGYIEELIQDQIWTPFPLMQNTERPDAVVAHLLEGKVAILVDGTPHALIAPSIFTQFYNSPEDYYERYLIATFLRIIRLISLFIALLLPSLYIAFATFHPEMLPSKFAIAMAAARAIVPFSPFFEAIAMEVSVEILREASIRLPGPMGPTIGIVGGLVIGNAAVSAGLVSPAVVIVVGLTTISSYANPNFNAAISVRLLRFIVMASAATYGLYGIMLSIMLILLHMVQLRSFNVPYMAPYAPLDLQDLKDSIIRVPWKWMKTRPVLYSPDDVERERGENS